MPALFGPRGFLEKEEDASPTQFLNWQPVVRKSMLSMSSALVCSLVVARLATRSTIIKAVMTESNVQFGLTQRTVLLAYAFLFRQLTLHATKLRFCCSSHSAI